jgi:hypothetical protein
MMKELYQEAEIEIIRFDAVDIITTSTTNETLDPDELPPVIVP